MIKKISAVLLSMLIVLAFFSGCGKTSAPTNQTGQNGIQIKKHEEVTIVVPMLNSQKDLAEYAEELLKSKGFNISFLAYPKESGYFDYDHYISFCEKASKEYPNVVMIIKSGNDISGYILQKSSGLIKDIKTVFEKNAPSYYSKHMTKDTDKVYEVPLGVRDNKTIRQLAVLVKNEYAKDYKDPIKTANDYAKFLGWAASQAKGRDEVPGYMPVGIYEKSYYNSYVPFDLFAQQYDYISASTVLPLDVGGIYTELFPKGEQNLYPLENIPEFKTAMAELCSWIKQGWMECGFAKNIPDDLSKYASIVVNTLDYVKRDASFFFANENVVVDASEYTMFMLYPDRTPHPWNNITEYDYRAVISTASKNPEGFFWFLDWLDNSQENYDYFHYGILNSDYVMEGDKVKSLQREDGTVYANWGGLDCFTISSYNRTSPLAPSNWKDIRETASGGSVPLLEAFSQKRQQAISLNSKYIQRNDFEKIGQRENGYIDFFVSLLSTPQSDAEKKIDDFIFKLKETDNGTYLAERFYSMYSELASN